MNNPAPGCELADRLERALDFDAQNGTDYQWSNLMAEAMNALDALRQQSHAGDERAGEEGIVAADDCEHLFSVVKAPDGSFFAVRDSSPKFVFHSDEPLKAAATAVLALMERPTPADTAVPPVSQDDA